MNDDVLKAKQRFSIIGNSPALLAAIERAVKVAPIDLSVLVTGESGSGKEFFPKIIHAFGARKHKKYIAVNCGAIPEGTIDSELFGHEKGSFTGAISTRKGYFEEADGGTIFLDEVAELPLTTQARLLRVLESGEFLKVGSSQVQKTDIRIVAATNVDLLQAVAKGKFREDLYYRLSTVRIEVPNLHDRGDDIILLARKFAADFAEKYLTSPITFSEEARRAMLLYRWPGNVRQLKNIVEQLALFNAGEEISRRLLIESLPLDHSGNSSLMATKQEGSYESEREMLWQLVYQLKHEVGELREKVEGINGNHLHDPSYHSHAKTQSLIKYEPSVAANSEIEDVEDVEDVPTLEDSERDAVAAALRRNGGNKKKAAEQLNISPRTLYRKIHDLGLIIVMAFLIPLFSGCIPSYKFNGSALNYDIYRTIDISDFPIRAALVYPPLQQTFENKLLNTVTRQTRLQEIDGNADLEMTGEITGYSLSPQAVGTDAYATQTRLTITVRVKYTDTKNSANDVDQSFSAYRQFDSSMLLIDVQDDLCNEICDELVDLIFNATLGNW